VCVCGRASGFDSCMSDMRRLRHGAGFWYIGGQGSRISQRGGVVDGGAGTPFSLPGLLPCGMAGQEDIHTRLGLHHAEPRIHTRFSIHHAEPRIYGGRDLEYLKRELR